MESEELDPQPVGPSEVDRGVALQALCDGSGWKIPDAPLDLGDLRWKPDLTATGAVLHLSMTGALPGPWIRRMEAAAKADLKLTFATTATTLDVEALLALQSLDARIAIIDLSGDVPRVRAHRSVADLIAAERLFIDPGALRALAEHRLAEAGATDNNSKKGRWFEEVLCLVFSQVSWLTVDEHAYNNATEEIDLLISCRAVGYIAQLIGSPLVVATAKNENKATNSQTVKYLKEQVANRKGRCKLGFLCSASTISDDAKGEILRGSQSADIVIACIDREALVGLIQGADELDERLEALIRAAIAD
jgi:hypothetical protein